MSGRSFLDTNILVYTDALNEPTKRQTAIDLIKQCRRRRIGVISIQVLQEYYNASTRKGGVPLETARRKVVLFSRMQVVTIGVADLVAAIDLQRHYSLSIWDALIVRAAVASGCSRIYSEDMQHGQKIEGCEIVNPFLLQPSPIA